MNRFLSPLRYPGGKTAIYPFLSSLLNENNLLGCSYAEPYAGGGGVALKLLKNNLVKDIYLNDYDKAIYSLWYSILNYSDELIKWIQDIVINVENWEMCRDIYKNEKEPYGSLLYMPKPLNAGHIKASEIPMLIDEIPLAIIMFAALNNTTIMEGLSELKFKESDRLASSMELVSKMGAKACY